MLCTENDETLLRCLHHQRVGVQSSKLPTSFASGLVGVCVWHGDSGISASLFTNWEFYLLIPDTCLCVVCILLA